MVTAHARKELRCSIRVCALLFVMIFVIIGVRVWSLQVLRAPELTRMLERQYRTSVLLAPKRGTVYDRNGNELAISIQVESVFAHPYLISDLEHTAAALAEILQVPSSTIMRRLQEQKPFVWIERKITPHQARAIRELQLPGIEFVAESGRFYPNGELAGQVLGFTGVDSDGLEGLEFQFNAVLSGTPRRVPANRDAHGRRLFSEGFCTSINDDGSDMYLTIDTTIQHIAEKELEAAVSASRAKGGIAIVMDPWSGDVLAMAVVPLFDPNRYAQYRPDVWRNRAVADMLEPGSTFKTFLVAAALEENMLSPQDAFFCENGSYRVAGRVISDVKPHGWLNVAHIIKYSSNIGASKISNHLGMDLFYRYIRGFGFARETGIQLPGEAAGSVPLPYRIPEHTRSTIAFGHGVAVTPVQLAAAYSVIANGGVLIQPNMVRKIKAADGSASLPGVQAISERVLEPETARMVTEMLQVAVATGGTGERAAVSGFSVAGKTGTARKIYNGAYCSKRLIASFVGFCPVDNPRITVVVIIDEPEVMTYGGQSAAPAFSRISRQVLNYLNVAPHVQFADGAGSGHEKSADHHAMDRAG